MHQIGNSDHEVWCWGSGVGGGYVHLCMVKEMWIPLTGLFFIDTPWQAKAYARANGIPTEKQDRDRSTVEMSYIDCYA